MTSVTAPGCTKPSTTPAIPRTSKPQTTKRSRRDGGGGGEGSRARARHQRALRRALAKLRRPTTSPQRLRVATTDAATRIGPTHEDEDSEPTDGVETSPGEGRKTLGR